MKQRQKRIVATTLGGLLVLLLAARRQGKGTVQIGPVTVTPGKASLGSAQPSEVERLGLALVQSRRLMGADPNTFASRQPSAQEADYIRQTLSLGQSVSQKSNGSVPLPTVEQQRLALALKLPGSSLESVNRELYGLLGVNPAADNAATIPLTPAIEAQARSLIARWRPYSQQAVDTLFTLLDGARELATSGAA